MRSVAFMRAYFSIVVRLGWFQGKGRSGRRARRMAGKADPGAVSSNTIMISIFMKLGIYPKFTGRARGGCPEFYGIGFDRRDGICYYILKYQK
jgi:hypothetical protein